jgi:undecaprenyl-phosphate galactose phosphotransferase
LQVGSSWKKLCEKFGAQHVIIALDGKDLQETDKIMEKLAREPVSFSVAPPLQNLPVNGMVPHYFLNHNSILITHSRCIEQRLPQIIKRAIDVTVSAGALIVLSPVMLILAGLVKMDGGTALFGHNRLGLRGKTFPCMKFRTMVMGGDAILKQHLKENPEAAKEWQETQKLQNDPRVTRLGKFLRSTSLDELPQLINVLRGDMSLVGPRPIVRDEISHYKHDIAHYYRVRPGVTGLWQVSGRNDVSYAQRVQMDSWYVKNWSLWHDIAIICKTFPAVFKRSGAY